MSVENVDSEQQEETGGLDGTLSLEDHMSEGQEDDQGQDDQQQDEAPQLSPEQDKASRNGWTNKDAWIEAGKEPDDWVSANRFNEKGDMLDQIKSLRDDVTSSKQDFEQRLDNQQKLADIQLAAQRKDLTAQRKDAIENADVDKVDEIQGQLDELSKAPVATKPAASTSQQSEDDWNSSNPWILEQTPKAAYAKQEYSAALSRGQNSSDAIKSMEAKVAEHFPATNPRRDNAPAQESNRSKPGNKQTERKLQWSDLSRDEEKIYQHMPDAWANKAEFLATVVDTRKS